MDIDPRFLSVCETAVRSAAEQLRRWFGQVTAREKGPSDLVTQADLAAQEAVAAVVLSAFPDHALLGEEQTGSAAGRAESEYRWIVDPLDGTTNYVHRVPHYAVSLALERSGEVLVGAVYDPHLDECFTAVRGRGAALNGEAIRTSRVARLSEALAAVGFPPALETDSDDLKLFQAAVRRCQSIRRTGSAALNLAYVAAGRFDVYWSFSTRIWDVAAGSLLVREAGGVITAPDGGPFVLEQARFIAASSEPLRADIARLWAECRRSPAE